MSVVHSTLRDATPPYTERSFQENGCSNLVIIKKNLSVTLKIIYI
jgi:hypothetical protein